MFVRTFAISTLAAIGVGLASSVFAGECPAGYTKPDAPKPVTAAAKGVTDKVLWQIHLGGGKSVDPGGPFRTIGLEAAGLHQDIRRNTLFSCELADHCQGHWSLAAEDGRCQRPRSNQPREVGLA